MILIIKKRKRTKEISLVKSNRFGLQTTEIKIKKPIVFIDLHFNDDFKVVHELVLKTLKIKKQKNLFLFPRNRKKHNNCLNQPESHLIVAKCDSQLGDKTVSTGLCYFK